MAKDILRLTEKKAAVKVSGSGVTETITLATDILASTQIVSGTPKVNIQEMKWTGEANSTITVTRNAKVIAKFVGSSPGRFDFVDSEYNDNVNNTSDIVVTTTGDAQLWLLLRKDSGYASKIETPEFGPYDNPNLVGQ